MFGVLLSVSLVPAVVSIIVTDPPPTSTEYNYSYNVVDPRTGDTKSLHEVRRGDVVTGSYSVLDPDGTQRVVEYSADSRRGFKAVVHSEPLTVPIHHAVRDRFYFPRGNTHYVNEYYSSHTLFRDHPTPQPDVRVTKTAQPASMPSANQSRERNNNMADNRQTRYFTPSNQIRSSPPMEFKRGEYFAPNN